MQIPVTIHPPRLWEGARVRSSFLKSPPSLTCALPLPVSSPARLPHMLTAIVSMASLRPAPSRYLTLLPAWVTACFEGDPGGVVVALLRSTHSEDNGPSSSLYSERNRLSNVACTLILELIKQVMCEDDHMESNVTRGRLVRDRCSTFSEALIAAARRVTLPHWTTALRCDS